MAGVSFNWELNWTHVFAAASVLISVVLFIFSVVNVNNAQALEIAAIKDKVLVMDNRGAKVFDLIRSIDQRLSRIEGKLDVKP